MCVFVVFIVGFGDDVLWSTHRIFFYLRKPQSLKTKDNTQTGTREKRRRRRPTTPPMVMGKNTSLVG